VFTSSRQECVGQRLPCLSRSSRSVCAHCAGVSWRERRPPTPEPNLKPIPETSLICDPYQKRASYATSTASRTKLRA
jgi:hypothetical protein